MSGLVIDLFAGCGGWDLGALALGLDPIGIEWMPEACETRAAAGLRTVRADLETWPRPRGEIDMLIASPPCQDFSAAGKRAGRGGDRGQLIDLVPIWVHETRPRVVVCEQVPPALPVWQEHAAGYRASGYSTWTGILNAADFGVPQTRRRAILIARLDGPALPPEPTHAQNPTPSLFGPDLEPWVSMAEALGWYGEDRPVRTVLGSRTQRWMYDDSDGTRGRMVDAVRVGFPRVDDRGDSPDGYRERDWRGIDEPAFALTEKARSWVVEQRRGGDRIHEGFTPAEPAATVTSRVNRWQVTESPLLDLAADELVVNTGRDWKPGGTRDDAQVVPLIEPAPSVDTKGRWRLCATNERPNAALRSPDEPAPTMAFGHNQPRWVQERPATTIAGDPRVWPPGHKINQSDIDRLGQDEAEARCGDRAGTEAIRLGIAEALVLQSFPADFPLRGSRTAQFLQVGNAVPPQLAAAIIATVVA